MRLRELIIEKIGYKLGPCLYNRFHDPLFDFIKSKTPKDFLHKKIYDLGCGDGENTQRIKRVFNPKEITACDRSEPMLERAKKKGFKTQYLDFNKEFPKGEVATFTYSLHHAYNKEEVLQKTINNFEYLFICEPYLKLSHFFDWGHVPSKKYWVELFDKVLIKYDIFEFGNNLIIFFKKKR